VPEYFFSMYSPPRSDATARAERDRLEEDIRFVAKSVREEALFLTILPHLSLTHAAIPGTQIANVCITLNEFPYIRYYVPAHHGPLGALRPHENTRAAPRPPENSLRWRTNLARGEHARQYEAAEAEVLSRVIAFEVQAALDEYKRANPDFPVRLRLLVPLSLFVACCVRGWILTGPARIETGSGETACNVDCYGASDGRCRPVYSRFYVSGNGE
jgi:syntaxin-binding protein 1